MEHIIVSESTTRSAPIIPYVCSKAWDRLPFLEYMERENWNEAQLIGMDDSHQRNEAEILDFLQTWLFFGLLSEACGEKGHRAYFIQELPDGQYVICTTNLRAIHRLELKRRDKQSKDESERWQSHLVQCLDAVHSVLARLAIDKVS